MSLTRKTPLRKKSRTWRVQDKLDRAWRMVVTGKWEFCALRDNDGTCFGYKRFELHCHHILSRQAHPKLRTEPLNGLLLCVDHHRHVHAEPKYWQPIIAKRLGEDWDKLCKLSQTRKEP